MIVERTASVAVDRAAEHAEGPIWDGRDETLMWVDQYRGIVRRARVSESGRLRELDRFDLGMTVGAIAPSSDGGWIVAAGDGFHSLARDGSVHPIADVLPATGPRRRMNDGKADPLGRFWAGSMAYAKDPGAGALYRLDHGEAREVLSGVTISNGLAWADDGATMYYIDTPTQTIMRYVVTDHGVDEGSTVVRIAEADGAPDGMCIDGDGYLWVALWGGRAVHRYDPDGVLVERVSVDAQQVSSCCFGGPDGSTLYITTSQEGYGPAQQVADPLAGMIFACETDTAAPPAAIVDS
ncbi:SMP-30/gluconolactonase/LRE family protein [Leifsonia poae]|uniref:SMP-30/gluconolactonase/LRE family protein n=1 Tax=Leifsonia poae TaxID=110933 RepID=UPI003D6746D9